MKSFTELYKELSKFDVARDAIGFGLFITPGYLSKLLFLTRTEFTDYFSDSFEAVATKIFNNQLEHHKKHFKTYSNCQMTLACFPHGYKDNNSHKIILGDVIINPYQLNLGYYECCST